MKVLWILNMVLPKVAKELNLKTSFSGGWLVDYADRLSADENIELATMTYAKVDQDIDETVCGIRNFIFAGGGKRLLFHSAKTDADCQKVIDEFKPDIIHIHGTEYAMGYSIVRLCHNIPVVLSIQGVLTRISQEYYGGIPLGKIFTMSKPKAYLRLKAPIFAKMLFKKNAKRERIVLRNVKYVTGVTLWDKALMFSINPELKYYRLNCNLRSSFYSCAKWNAETMTPHTIYTGAATYALKGLHNLIKAVAIVKNTYPNVKLLIPANNSDYEKANGYERFILKLVEKENLQENVSFIGRKTAEEVAQILTTAHVCVVPSAMEGASTTLCEAMLVGTPSISSYRGGMTDLLREGESGFYYDFNEYPVLAEKIMMLFGNIELCKKISQNVQKDSAVRHDRETNYAKLKSIYHEVLENEKRNA